jgi:acetylornithine deacetylase/succinyl-diaminopimelate desuccinylase-like protein
MRLAVPVALLGLLIPGLAGADAPLTADQKLVRDIFEELIEIDTSSTGSTSKAAVAMAKRLKTAGFAPADVQVLGPVPKKGNLVARLRGSGKRKPLLLLAHLDVVDARRDDWSLDPFTFTEKDGYYYGRGTTDDKGMAAIFVATLIRLKKEGYVPDRDLIVALTADEEGGDHNGVSWLLKDHRDLLDAEYCINEGGGGEMKAGRYVANSVQASEKVYQSFVLETRNKGGHSSMPVKDNAIVRLAAAVTRIGAFDFPVSMSEITRGYFAKMSAVETGQLAKDMKAILKDKPDPAAVKRLSGNPLYNAKMRTTCVPTRLEGGHADNALPQSAKSIVNCRLLPGHASSDVLAALQKVVADPQVSVKPKAEAPSGPASPLLPDVMQAIERLTQAMWPGVPVVPTMSTGATDGLYLRRAGIPTYGVDGIFLDIDDVRAHGRDERVGVKQFFDGYEFLYRLTRELSGGATTKI